MSTTGDEKASKAEANGNEGEEATVDERTKEELQQELDKMVFLKESLLQGCLDMMEYLAQHCLDDGYAPNFKDCAKYAIRCWENSKKDVPEENLSWNKTELREKIGGMIKYVFDEAKEDVREEQYKKDLVIMNKQHSALEKCHIMQDVGDEALETSHKRMMDAHNTILDVTKANEGLAKEVERLKKEVEASHKSMMDAHSTILDVNKANEGLAKEVECLKKEVAAADERVATTTASACIQLREKNSEIETLKEDNSRKDERIRTLETDLCLLCDEKHFMKVDLYCGHSFCRRCIVRHARSNKDCPTCQEDLCEDLVKEEPQNLSHDVCHWCTKVGRKNSMKICNGCKEATYCNEDCAEAAWWTHKRTNQWHNDQNHGNGNGREE